MSEPKRYDAKRKDELDLDRSAIYGRIILKEKVLTEVKKL